MLEYIHIIHEIEQSRVVARRDTDDQIQLSLTVHFRNPPKMWDPVFLQNGSH